MITATVRTATRPTLPPPPGFRVRPACDEDAAALLSLSEPFMRSGALRRRPLALYASCAGEFLVVDAPDGTLAGCLGTRVHPGTPANGRGAAGVLYNFCVASRSQGNGVGTILLDAALHGAQSLSLEGLFTATTGSGALFLRHGFAPADASLAPEPWVASLSPERDARILSRAL